MNIIVTGSKGFIGSHLVHRLEELGFIVTGFDIREDPTQDIVNEYKVSKTVINQDVIYHLAAQPDIGKSIQTPLETIAINSWGTLNLLEALRKQDLHPHFILASTASVYSPFREIYPTNPYSASKLAAEGYTLAYGKQYSIPVTIGRYSNIYGPRQYGGVIHLFIERAMRGLDLTCTDDERDFLFIDDAIAAYIAMLKDKNDDLFPNIYDIASGIDTSIKDLANLIVRLTNSESKVLLPTSQHGQGVRIEQDVRIEPLNISRAKTCLNWEPKTSLLDGLEQVISWYRANSHEPCV